MLKMLKKFILLVCMLITIVHAEPEKPETPEAKPNGLFTQLKKHNLGTIEWEDEDWETDDFIEYLNHIMKNDLEPSPHRKRSRAFQFMEENEKRVNPAQNNVIDTQAWHDLNLFAGSNDVAVYLCSKLDRTITELGKVTFFGMVANPTKDVTQITKTQNIIKELISNPTRLALFRQKITDITTSENVLLSFWGRDSFKHPIRRSYFDYPLVNNDRLNNNEALLEAKSLVGHGSRIAGICSTAITSLVLCAYGTLILTNKLEKPEWVENWANKSSGFLVTLFSIFENKWFYGSSFIASGILCGLGIKEQIEWTQGNILLENCIQQKLMYVAQYLSCMESLHALLQDNPVLQENFPELGNIDKLFTTLAQKSAKLNELFILLATETFQDKPSFFSDKGNILLAYRLMHEVKKDLEDAVVAVAMIDAYVSIAQLYKEFESKPVKFCFAQFIDNQTPFIELNNFWNPFVDPAVVIPNNLRLGSVPANRNVIVTGPNAGGKSTILKAIAVNLILAQSIGIAPAENLVLTPFSKISTYLNICDDIAVGNSLFKSEVLRAQNLLTTIQNQKDREFSFTIFDEIFSGTSPKEGEAAAFSVAKHLGEFKNNISVIATHFPLLTTLERVSPYFSNYKVSVHHLRDGSIAYPFKLEPGVSDQHIAIDILRIEGFDTKILDDAHTIINNR